MSTLVETQSPSYLPLASLVPGTAHAQCRACVTIPVRNEEKSLPACLDALAAQIDLHGVPLDFRSFEVLLLLNNCTDASVAVAVAWQQAHPAMQLRCIEITLKAKDANAGTARKLLLDTAWCRLAGCTSTVTALLCTDADSVVAPDWIARNLEALTLGADVVGGQIELVAAELKAMPAQLRRCYQQDRLYGELSAQLEDLLDPQPGDAWPRHQHHFGSSLACTPAAYARAGGMPPVPVLEDAAFVQEVRRAGLRLRHEPRVRIFTSARLRGRTRVGLAAQLRQWSHLPADRHLVQSAAFVAHRFSTLARLRQAFALRSAAALSFPTQEWRQWAETTLQTQHTLTDFFAAIDSDGLIAATFQGECEQPIVRAIAALQAAIEAAMYPQSAEALSARCSTDSR